MLTLSQNENNLDGVDDTLSPHNRPETPSSDFASSNKFNRYMAKDILANAGATIPGVSARNWSPQNFGVSTTSSRGGGPMSNT